MFCGSKWSIFSFQHWCIPKNDEIKHSFIQQLRPNTSLRRSKSRVKTLRQPFLDSPIYSTLLPPSLPTYPMNPSSKSMARDKHKSPQRWLIENNLNLRTPLRQSYPAFLQYGFNLKPSLSGSQLKLDSQVEAKEVQRFGKSVRSDVSTSNTSK